MELQNTQNYDQLLDEAIEWISKLNDGILSTEDNQVFIDWVNSSADHRRAYQEMSEVWQLTENVQNISEFRQEAEEALQKEPASESNKVGLMAAVASIVVFVGILFTQFLPSTVSIEERRLTSLIGETKNIKLDDGSKVILNTNTLIEVVFSNKERSLKLIKGEALFEVAHDQKRPFIVDIGNGYVRAIGTAFNIKKEASNTVITVTEGIVKIDKPNSNAESIKAIKNDQVIVGKQANISVRNIDITPSLSWIDLQLTYLDTPIENVLNDLSTYFEVPLSVHDDSLKKLTVNGTLNVDDPEQALSVLLAGFNLKTVKKRDYREVIRQ